MAANVQIKIDKGYVLKWVVMLLVPAAILLIPVNEVFTGQMKCFFAITLFGILSFVLEPFDYSVGALFMMVAFVLAGVAPMEKIFSPFTKTVPWMVFGCILLVNIIQRKTTLIDRIACFCMIKTGGTYKGIIYGLMILGVVMNIIVPGVFTGMAVGALAYGICKALHLGKSKASSGIMLAAIIGFIEAWTFIYCPADMGVLIGMAEPVMKIPMDYFTYFKYCWVFIPFPLILGFMITRLCKPEMPVDGKAYFMEKQVKLGKMTLNDKKTLLVLLVFVLYLFTFQWHHIDMVYGFILAPLILYLPGFRLGSREDIANANLPMLLFVVGCMSIGVAATELGVGELVSQLALPVLSNASSSGFILLTYIFITAFNFVMTPLAEIAAFAVPLTQISVDLGMDPFPMLVAFNRGCNNVLLPYEATMIAAFYAFGNTRMDCFVKCFGAKMLITGIWLFVVACPYWKLLGLL